MVSAYITHERIFYEIIGVGNVETIEKELDYKTVKENDSALEEGQTKVKIKGVKGKKVTKTTYKVNKANGELTDPVEDVVEDVKPIDEVAFVGTKKVIPAKLIEDIAKTTKTAKEVIKAKVVYESDDSLTFEEKKVIKEPVDGEEEITIISIPGQEDVITKKTLKDPEDGLTKVGDKKVETKTNEDGSTTTTTTIYDVNPDTGELVNPRSTSTAVKKPQNELYEPEGADQTTDVNKPLKPEDFITNIKDLPEGTEFEFKEQPDFKKPGEYRVVIVATYPDGTKDTVENKLIVKDVGKPSTSSKTSVEPNTVKPATTAPARTNVKAQTGGGVGTIGGLIAGLTAAASSIFKRRKK